MCEKTSQKPEIILNDDFILGKNISKGGFGYVYYGYSIKRDKYVAIKLENIKDNKHKAEYLPYEYSILTTLLHPQDDIKPQGIPNVYWFAQHDDFNVMVSDLCGTDLDKILKKHLDFTHKHFTFLQVARITYQMISIIEHIHRFGYVHCDIKPHNFVSQYGFDINTMNDGISVPEIFIIDFGLAKKIYSQNGCVLKHVKTHSHAGTPKYMSINAHNGGTPTRRDDLESMIYIIFYLLGIKLEWFNINISDKDERNRKIMSHKSKLNCDEICDKYNIPIEFRNLFNYIINSTFYTIPDYHYLKNLIADMF